jgi:hypothetical protein
MSSCKEKPEIRSRSVDSSPSPPHNGADVVNPFDPVSIGRLF